MPHAVVEGPLTAARVHADLQPFEERRGTTVLKLRESFLSRDRGTALIEAVVVEGTPRRFYLEIADRPGGITLRLHPLTDPEKTDGVKTLLARVAQRLLALAPGARITHTNLGAWLAPAADAAGSGPDAGPAGA